MPPWLEVLTCKMPSASVLTCWGVPHGEKAMRLGMSVLPRAAAQLVVLRGWTGNQGLSSCGESGCLVGRCGPFSAQVVY